MFSMHGIRDNNDISKKMGTINIISEYHLRRRPQEINLDLNFLSRATRLYTPLCRSVRRSIGPSVHRSVGPSVTLYFFGFLRYLALLLLLK